MKSYSKRYEVLNQYAVRIPIFPLSFLRNIYNSKCIESSIWNLLENPIISEAIYLASPDLFESVQNVQKGAEVSAARKQNLTLSLLKYLTRLCSRPTPFGLFAGTNMGSFSEGTKVLVDSIENHSRKTRLDFAFLAMLLQNLVDSENILKHLQYYPNTSLYKLTTQHRYIKTAYHEGKKEYTLQNITANLELDKTLEFAKNGKAFEELKDFLIELGHTPENVMSFLKMLISKQILISSLSQYTIGTDYQAYLLSNLEQFKTRKEVTYLHEFTELARKLDTKLGNDIEQYKTLSSKALNLIPTLKKNRLVQVNLYPNFSCNHLNRKIKISISRAFNVLTKIAIPNKSNDMEQFVRAFEKRYETMEMPLANVLDLDQGLGYPVDRNKSKYPYLSDFNLENNSDRTNKSFELNEKELFFAKLLSKKKIKRLELSETDWNKLKSTAPNLNATNYSIIQIFGNEDNPQIFLKGISGSSASNLLGRFADSSEDIRAYIQNIHVLESDFHRESLVAEIAHFPENRTGNILFRPEIRDYKINFLSGVNRKNDGSINIKNLMISVRNGNAYLRSTKYGKRVVPYLSNAHKYSNSSLPIYRFLCDFQHHTYSSGLLFSWGNLENIYDHLPRLSYKEIIFAKEQWLFSTSSILDQLNMSLKDQDLLKIIKNWRKARGIPQYVQLKQGDNLLLIDLLNPWSIRMFLNSIRTRGRFKLVEFLFENNLIVQNSKGEDFVNEFIVAYHRKKDVYEN